MTIKNISKEFIKNEVLSKKNINDTINVLNKLKRDKFGDDIILSMKNNKNMDIRPTLSWLSKYISPKNYMEIGIRIGYSLACVTSFSPKCDVFGFDMWVEKYAGVENPGIDFVLKQIKKTKHEGKINFINGDTKKTLPLFFKENDITFDLITVDGDHSIAGAKNDLFYAFQKCNKGGAIVFDDIAIKSLKLNKVWNEMENIYKNYNFFSFKEGKWGVGIAFKM